MSTLTTRLSLLKAAGTDLVNVLTQIANALDKLDDALGVFTCTAATHPVVNLFDGRLIRETDTGKVLRYDAVAVEWKLFDTRGIIGFAEGPAIQTDYGVGPTNVCSQTLPVVAGRKYKMSAQILGVQITGSGNVDIRMQVTGTSGTMRMRIIALYVATVNQRVYGSGFQVYTATSTGNETFYMTVMDSANAFRVTAFDGTAIVEDIGV